jgi:hypothetical protein
MNVLPSFPRPITTLPKTGYVFLPAIQHKFDPPTPPPDFGILFAPAHPPRFEGQSTLPEQPLISSPVFGIENIAEALAVLPLIRGIQGSLQALDVLRRITILSGNPKLDVPFYAATFISPALSQKFHEIQAGILQTPLPHPTVTPGSFVSNLVRAEPSEAQILSQFLRGLTLPEEQFQAQLAALRRDLAVARGGGLFGGEGTNFARKSLQSFEEGASGRELIAAQNAIAAEYARALVAFWQAMTAAGQTNGTGGNGPFPGERGDPPG